MSSSSTIHTYTPASKLLSLIIKQKLVHNWQLSLSCMPNLTSFWNHHLFDLSLSLSLRQLEGYDLPYLTPDEIRSVTQLPNGELFLPVKPTPSSDIFAFGTLTYELVTLKSPFQNQSLLELVWSIGNNRVQSLEFLPRSCFRSVIHRCWSLTKRTTFKNILSSIQDNTLFPPNRYSSTSLPLSSQLCTLRQWRRKNIYIYIYYIGKRREWRVLLLHGRRPRDSKSNMKNIKNHIIQWTNWAHAWTEDTLKQK